MIFDTHTHLNAEQFNDDIPETIAHAQELGVTEMAVVGLMNQRLKNLFYLVRNMPIFIVLLVGIQQKRVAIRQRLNDDYKNN